MAHWIGPFHQWMESSYWLTLLTQCSQLRPPPYIWLQGSFLWPTLFITVMQNNLLYPAMNMFNVVKPKSWWFLNDKIKREQKYYHLSFNNILNDLLSQELLWKHPTSFQMQKADSFVKLKPFHLLLQMKMWRKSYSIVTVQKTIFSNDKFNFSDTLYN